MNKPTYLTGSIQSMGYRILREHAIAVLELYELTPTQWAMLGIVLSSADGVRQSAIAQSLRVKPPLITNITKMFEERGIVQAVPNQFDARAKLLAITPEGKKFMKSVEADLHAKLGLLLQGLTEEEMQIYHKVLVTIIENDALQHKAQA